MGAVKLFDDMRVRDMRILPIQLAAVCVTLLACPVLWGAGYADELSRLTELVSKGNHKEAIEGYMQLIQSQDTPAWLRGPLYLQITSIYAGDGSKEEALAALDQAVKSGYDDCLEIEQDKNMDALRGDARFTAIVGRIRESQADYQEAFWLKAEALTVDHETKMLITANINRVDHDFTSIIQSQIPTRETSSPGVLYMRELVRIWQGFEKRVILKADGLRIQHAATMAAISGPPSASTVYLSSHTASAAAEERARAVQQRAFVPTMIGKSELRSCADFTKK